MTFSFSYLLLEFEASPPAASGDQLPIITLHEMCIDISQYISPSGEVARETKNPKQRRTCTSVLPSLSTSSFEEIENSLCNSLQHCCDPDYYDDIVREILPWIRKDNVEIGEVDLTVDVKLVQVSQFDEGETGKEIVSYSTSCVICMEGFSDDMERIDLPCRHSFHKACINKWLRRKDHCPTCRREIQFVKIEEEGLRTEE